MKPKIIDDNKRNVLLDTTGLNRSQLIHSSSNISSSLSSSLSSYSSPPPPSPLAYSKAQQKIQFLQDILSKLSTVYLYIHKLQIRTNINKEYYNDIDIKPDPVNGAKICGENISRSRST